MNVDERTRQRLSDIADTLRERDTEAALWLLTMTGQLVHTGWTENGEPTFRLKEDGDAQ